MQNVAPSPVYISRTPWNNERPGVLVIACSDGRLQENLDDFLAGHLDIHRYDRLYMPGGPGALVSSGVEYLRSDLFRRECAFLVESHDIHEVILIFHGAGHNGPPEASCADYRRLMPRHHPEEIFAQQLTDARDLLHAGFGWNRRVRVRIYRCEVMGTGMIRFVSLNLPEDC